jgi:hypothetical protein
VSDDHLTLRDGDDAEWKSVGIEWNRRDVTRAGDVDLVDPRSDVRCGSS